MSPNELRLHARVREQERACILESIPLERLLMYPGRPDGARTVEHDESNWLGAATGTRWGGPEEWAWFRAWFRVPAEWRSEQVRLSLPLGGQCMAYLDGLPLQGLDENHRTITLPATVCDGNPHLMAIECYASPNTTIVRQPHDAFTIGDCRVELIDPEAEAFFYDLSVGVDALGVLPVAAPERAPLLNLLLAAENHVDRRDPGSAAFRTSVHEARAALQEGLATLAAGSAPDRPRVHATGHAHIDTAWLWTLAQTRRKVARSWSTVLRLMERYPDYHFVGSQPQQYRWMEEDEPDLYRQVLARIREGRWEPIGAMWVEPDANLTSGESLVRQFLYGQRYLKEHFGHTCGVLWLPDAFGYSAALPQLMRSAGVHTFVTIKLSWNTVNRMPHDTFRWRGNDGTEVLGYFMTAGSDWRLEDLVQDPAGSPRAAATYNGDMSPQEVVGSWVRYKDKAINGETLYAFGWGDGGGGPTERMLEYAARLRDYPGLPRVAQGNVEQFLHALHDRVWDDPRTAVWEGELYLEYHRGTYTSQARVKWDNRRADLLLHDAELWCTWAALLGAAHSAWQERLAHCWETVLLNQFHDILPGSSIGEVYQDQRRQHAEVLAIAGGVLAEAQEAIGAGIDAPDGALAIFSAVPWQRDETLEIAVPPSAPDGDALLSPDGVSLPTQQVEYSSGRRSLLVSGLTVPPLGYTVVRRGQGAEPVHHELAVEERRLENRFFRLTLDEHGNMASLYDKWYEREVLAPGGGGNQLLAFEDKPINYDAWDIDEFYAEKCWTVDDVQDWRVVERGPVRAGIEIVRRFGPSTIRQRILLYADTPRIDIHTNIDWHHRQVLLKAAFPLAVHATQATYESAFGYVQRPTHRNTSWDAARFEVAAHRWADLSETGYGVSLLNDGKYGHDCLGNVLRLTLLKSAIMPDPMADEGEHSFSYALLPHGPEWSIEDTVRAAYAFNLPVHTHPLGGQGGRLPSAASFVTSDRPHAVIDTVKPAEDGASIIVRVYDCANRRGRMALRFTRAIDVAAPVTILEEPDSTTGAIEIQDNILRFELLPFAVRTFRITLRT